MVLRPTLLLLLTLACGAAAFVSAPSARRSPMHRDRASLRRVLAAARTPEERANMAKWGRILSQADTTDGDYLKKVKGRPAAPATKPQSGGVVVVVVASCLVLGLLASSVFM